jgi:zinc finger FYVE domain-containing protein 1
VGLATYAWSGFVLECRFCGVIYRSRQHWYGNETPESMEVVHTDISHIWPGTRTLQGDP